MHTCQCPDLRRYRCHPDVRRASCERLCHSSRIVARLPQHGRSLTRQLAVHIPKGTTPPTQAHLPHPLTRCCSPPLPLWTLEKSGMPCSTPLRRSQKSLSNYFRMAIGPNMPLPVSRHFDQCYSPTHASDTVLSDECFAQFVAATEEDFPKTAREFLNSTTSSMLSRVSSTVVEMVMIEDVYLRMTVSTRRLREERDTVTLAQPALIEIARLSSAMVRFFQRPPWHIS